MRALILAAIIGVAAVVWLAAASLGPGPGGAEDAAVRERFEGVSGGEKRNALVADIMDLYKDEHGRYPATEVLVHYRDSAASGGLTKAEIKARIKADGGSPPGLAVASEAAERDLAKEAAAAPAPAVTAPAPPPPGARPPAAAPHAVPLEDRAGVSVRVMNIAMQLSALAEELQVQRPKGGPEAFENFISF